MFVAGLTEHAIYGNYKRIVKKNRGFCNCEVTTYENYKRNFKSVVSNIHSERAG